MKVARELIKNVLIGLWALGAKKTYLISASQHTEQCLAHSQYSVGNDYMNEHTLSPASTLGMPSL